MSEVPDKPDGVDYTEAYKVRALLPPPPGP
jgi:hypothetical protein